MPYSLIDDDVSSAAPTRRLKTAYRSVSGLVSGYRYFSANLSRWISRDPILDPAISGINVPLQEELKSYLFVGNTPLDEIDILGLLGYLDTPQDPEKCKKAFTAINFWASAVGGTTYDLWSHFVGGTANTLSLSFDKFDQGGLTRAIGSAGVRVMTLTALATAANLECDQQKMVISKSLQSPQQSMVLMIFKWVYTLHFEIYQKKNCDECKKCKSLSAWANITHEASDETDFDNPGEGFLYGTTYVTDDLVTECGLGKGFNISAKESDVITASIPCSL